MYLELKEKGTHCFIKFL